MEIEEGEGEDDKHPAIFDGKYFVIVNKDDNNVKAKCLSCKLKENVLSGSTTSNFLKHIKVSQCMHVPWLNYIIGII
jgi:hypothetical protein